MLIAEVKGHASHLGFVDMLLEAFKTTGNPIPEASEAASAASRAITSCVTGMPKLDSSCLDSCSLRVDLSFCQGFLDQVHRILHLRGIFVYVAGLCPGKTSGTTQRARNGFFELRQI